MALPIPPFDPNSPIPDSPFYAPATTFLYSGSAPLVIGSGLSIDQETGTLISTGGGTFPVIAAGTGIFVTEDTGVVTIGNSGVLNITAGFGITVSSNGGAYVITNSAPAPTNYGTVTQINSGTGLTGGPITTSGTISLSPVTTVSPGTYTYATVGVDQYGRVTYAAPGTPPLPVQGSGAISVSATNPQIVSVDSATTATPGVVIIDNSTSSTSTTKAATANAVKTTFDIASSAFTCAGTAKSTADLALSTANSAITVATTASSNASAAVSTANTAQTEAATALSTANAAQTDATQALSDASTAQSAANAANALAGVKVSCASFSGKGQLLAGQGVSSFSALDPGNNGQVLTADSNCALGLKWQTFSPGTVTKITAGSGLLGGVITTTGTISLANTAVSPGTYTYSTITVDAQGRLTSASNGVPPLNASFFTNKGQVLTALSASNPYVLEPGTTGQLLQVNSNTLSGLEWVDSDRIPCSLMVSKGSLLTSANSAPAALPVGPDGFYLSASGSQPTGLEWRAVCKGTVTSVSAGAGLAGGTITNSGTISLGTTGVTPGNYVYSTITVDSTGRISSASSGVAPFTSVTAPITNTGSAAAPVIGVQTATSSSLGVVKAGTNININTAGQISVNTASEIQSGVVKLHNTLDSTSTTEALTAAQGKVLNDKINIVSDKTGIVIAGTYNPSLRVVETVTSAGTAAGFVVGQDIPDPAPNNDNYFVIATSDETYTPPQGTAPYATTQGDWILSDGSTWTVIDAGKDIPPASTTAVGITRLSTPAETSAGVLDNIAVTPASLSGIFLRNTLLNDKGTLLTSDGNSAIPFPVGNDNEVLISSSSSPSGLAWTPDIVTYQSFTNSGYLLVGLGPEIPIGLAPGNDNQILSVCGACTGGLTWTDLPVNSAIPCSEITAKGDIITGTAASTPSALPVGTAGQFLTANPSCLTGLEWTTYQNTAIPCTCLVNKGDLLTGDGASPSTFPVGSDGYVLKACAACPYGMSWEIDTSSGGIPCALLTAKGQLIASTASNTPVALPLGTDGQYLQVNSNCAEGFEWSTLDNEDIPCSVITGAGVIITGSSANTPYALAPGSDGQVLKACSTCVGGLTWEIETPPADQDIPCSLITARGDLIIGDNPNIPVVLPRGDENAVLRVCSSCPQGIGWVVESSVAAIPCSALTAKGVVLTASAPSTPVALAAGVDNTYLIACSACPAGLTWTDAPNNSIPCNLIQAKGDLVVGSGLDTPSALPVGVQGYVLTSCDLAPTGMVWAPPTEGNSIPCEIISGKGTLIAGSAANTPSALAPGQDGYFLRACSACTTGLTWVPELVSQSIPCSILTARGDLIVAVDSGNPVALPVGADGRILKACNLCTNGVFWADDPEDLFIPLSVIQSKGQIVVGSGPGAATGLPLGSDGQILKVCVASAEGVAWIDNDSVNKIDCSVITEKGTLIAGSGANLPTAVEIGPDESLLVACAACPSGMFWTLSYPIRPATPTSPGGVYGKTDALNAYFGGESGCDALNGIHNTGIGIRALKNINSGSSNVALGFEALASTGNADGTANIAIGFCPGYVAVAGVQCKATYIGFCSGYTSSVGFQSHNGSIAMGANSMNSVQTACENIAIGICAGSVMSSSCRDIYIGNCAGTQTTGGNFNTTCNVALGYCALTIGGNYCNNIALGALSGNDQLRRIVDGTNDNLVLGNFNTERISSKVGLTVLQDSTTQGGSTVVSSPSALSILRNIEVRRYCLVQPGTTTRTDTCIRYGFDGSQIAAAETSALPGDPPIIAVPPTPGTDELYGVDTHNLLAATIAAIQDLQTQLDNINTILANNNIS